MLIYYVFEGIRVMMFKVTFNNISVILWGDMFIDIYLSIFLISSPFPFKETFISFCNNKDGTIEREMQSCTVL